jgi:hypothetical protein
MTVHEIYLIISAVVAFLLSFAASHIILRRKGNRP